MYKHISLARKVAAFVAAQRGEDVLDPASAAFKVDAWFGTLGKQLYMSMPAATKGPLPELEDVWEYSDHMCEMAELLLDEPPTFQNALAVQDALMMAIQCGCEAPVPRPSQLKSAILPSLAGQLMCGKRNCPSCPSACLFNFYSIEEDEDGVDVMTMQQNWHKNSARGHKPIGYSFTAGSSMTRLMKYHLEFGRDLIMKGTNAPLDLVSARLIYKKAKLIWKSFKTHTL